MRKSKEEHHRDRNMPKSKKQRHRDRNMPKSKEQHHRDRNMPKSKEQHHRDRALLTPRITAKAMGLHRVSTQIQIRARGPTKCLASDGGDLGLTATQA